MEYKGYPGSTVYDVVAKYNESDKPNEGFATQVRKTYSKECIDRTPAIIQRCQELLFKTGDNRSENWNDRWFAHEHKNVKIAARTKFLVNAHMLDVLPSEGE